MILLYINLFYSVCKVFVDWKWRYNNNEKDSNSDGNNMPIQKDSQKIWIDINSYYADDELKKKGFEFLYDIVITSKKYGNYGMHNISVGNDDGINVYLFWLDCQDMNVCENYHSSNYFRW